MIPLTTNLRRRRRALTMYLAEKNRWTRSIPPIVLKVIDENMEKITYLSNNPDNVNGKIKRALLVEYSSIEDLMRDFTFFETIGIVNIRPCPDAPRGMRPVNPDMIRINFMVLEDNLNDGDYDIKSTRDAPEKMEEDFLKDIMGGNIK